MSALPPGAKNCPDAPFRKAHLKSSQGFGSLSSAEEHPIRLRDSGFVMEKTQPVPVL